MTYTPPAELVERCGQAINSTPDSFSWEYDAARACLAASGLGEALTALRAILDVDRYHRHMDNCAVCRPFNEARALLARLDPRT